MIKPKNLWIALACLAVCLCSSVPLLSQQRGGQKIPSTVYGRVLYDNGDPLAGATIMVVDTKSGTTSDSGGRFHIQVPEGKTQLKVMFLGMEDRIVDLVPDKTQPDIVMKDASTTLDEVVFIGYSTMAKRDILGSISSLRADEMKTNTSSGDLMMAMKGKIAGLNIVSNSGEPGAGSEITLRGASSISGSGSPLYIVDGVPIESDNISAISEDASFSPLSNINLQDVESVEVLKDAASAAIYGSRAANGVVIITTKGGRLGEMRPTVRLSHISTIASLYRKIDVLTSDQFREVYANAMYFYNGTLPTQDWYSNRTHPYYAQSIDWQAELFRPSYQTKNNISLSGSTDKFSYNFSIGYNSQNPIVIYTSHAQFNVKGKFTYKILPWLKGGTNVYYSDTDYKRILSSSSNNQSALATALKTNPCLSPYDPITGEMLMWMGTGKQGRNPIALAKYCPYVYSSEWTMLSQWLELQLGKNLTFRTTVSLEKTDLSQDFYRNRELASNLSSGMIDTHQYVYTHSRKLVNENVFNYNKKIKKHSVSGTLGQSIQTNYSEAITLNGQDFIDSDIIPIQSATIKSNVSQSIQERALLSYFGRANYSYDGKYLVSAILRADGSSRFGADRRFGYFPSASIGWRFSKEPFFKWAKSVMTDGKIRASYGVTGNQNVGNYAWRGQYTSTDSKYDGQVAIKYTTMQNAELGWETTTQTNVGVDLNFWKDRLVLALDLYNKVSEDLLFSFPLNTYTGFSSVSRNYGTIANKGVEIDISSVPVSKGKFSWRNSLNIAFNKNRILSLPDDEDFIVGTYSLGRVGEPAGVFYAHKALGVYAYTKDNIWYDEDGTVREVRKGSINGSPFTGGDVIWADLDNNGIIDDDDRCIIGSPHPKFFGGVSNTLKYGDFSLTVLFDFSYGNKIMNELRRSRNQLSSTVNLGADALRAWKKEGDITDIPKIVYGDTMENFRASSITMEDGSFLRLSNVSLTYTVPQDFLRQFKIKGASVYLAGSNLLLWSRYTGYDPEISSSLNSFQRGIDRGSFPKSRTVNLGVDITF